MGGSASRCGSADQAISSRSPVRFSGCIPHYPRRLWFNFPSIVCILRPCSSKLNSLACGHDSTTSHKCDRRPQAKTREVSAQQLVALLKAGRLLARSLLWVWAQAPRLRMCRASSGDPDVPTCRQSRKIAHSSDSAAPAEDNARRFSVCIGYMYALVHHFLFLATSFAPKICVNKFAHAEGHEGPLAPPGSHPSHLMMPSPRPLRFAWKECRRLPP